VNERCQNPAPRLSLDIDSPALGSERFFQNAVPIGSCPRGFSLRGACLLEAAFSTHCRVVRRLCRPQRTLARDRYAITAVS